MKYYIMAVRGLKNLCAPAHLYLVLSLIGLFVITYQNIGNVNKLCIGYLECNVARIIPNCPFLCNCCYDDDTINQNYSKN